jgi:UrcA family protein
MKRHLILAHALLATGAMLAASGAPAAAGTIEAGNSVAVHFGDLDLKTDAGLKTLYRRISRAADEACGTYDVRDLNRVNAVRECRSYAMGNANHEVELAVAAAQRGEGYASAGSSLKVRAR